MKRPAETSSSSAIATCAATSPWRSQLRLRSAVACVPCSAGASDTREARRAGRSAKRTAQSAESSMAKATTRGSSSKIERDRHGQARLERREQTDERPPERQAGEAGGEREDQPFDEQLLQDPPARRSEREARRDLAPPFDRTREQDAGDVAARDQEHEAGEDPEHRDEADERQDRRRRHALRVGDVDAPARDAVVTLLGQVGVHDALQLVARLPRRGAGLEPADRRHPHRAVHRQRRAVASSGRAFPSPSAPRNRG